MSGDSGKEVKASEDSNQEVATKVTDSKTKARSRVLIKHSDRNLKKRIYLAKTTVFGNMGLNIVFHTKLKAHCVSFLTTCPVPISSREIMFI